MPKDEAVKKAVEVPARSVDAFAEAFQQFTKAASGGGEAQAMPRRYARFVVDHTVCAPGVFTEDFAVTIASLTSGAELAATREAQADPIALAFAYAKHAITKAGPADGDGSSDRRLSSAEAEWLWEALGQSGRQLVVSMFASVLSAGDEAAGKARTSLRVY